MLRGARRCLGARARQSGRAVPAPWTLSAVAPSGDHHVVLGTSTPLYSARFVPESVLSFHEPGLAAVTLAEGAANACHVRDSGEPAYAARFRRTFGFYEGIASVVDECSRWFSVRPDGERAFPQLPAWRWLGNSQEGRCVATGTDGYYVTSSRDGRVVAGPFAYAGDFRDGAAVVRDAASGLCMHVDRSGTALCEARFFDLDVLHKGLARARDARGWFHVRPDGSDAGSGARYAAIEPFYNGRALATTLQGARVVVDETGAAVEQLPSSDGEVAARLQELLVAYWAPFAVAHGLRAGFPRGTDTPTRTAAALRAAWTELGLLGVDGEPTAAGSALEREPFRSRAEYWLGPMLHEAWANRAAPAPGAHFRGASSGTAATSDLAVRVLAGYEADDFDAVLESAVCGLVTRSSRRALSAATVVDIGGGSGGLCARLRSLGLGRVVLCDRAAVLAAASPAACARGVERVALEFFDRSSWSGLPEADAYVLCRVLHDWDDDACIEILRAIASRAPAGARLLVVDRVVERVGEHGLLSLHMHLCNGGAERTAAEFLELFTRSGWSAAPTDGAGDAAPLGSTGHFLFELYRDAESNKSS